MVIGDRITSETVLPSEVMPLLVSYGGLWGLVRAATTARREGVFRDGRSTKSVCPWRRMTIQPDQR